MDIVSKFQEIVTIQNNHFDEPTGSFNDSISVEQISKIEELIEATVPSEFIQLYKFSNGQKKDGQGVLLGEQFIGADEIIRRLEFSRTLIKPDVKTIDYPDQSQQLLREIVNFYLSKAPKGNWHRMEFSCGVGSYSGPYLYNNENTSPEERETFKIEFQDYRVISETIKQIHELEKRSYGWDKLNFVVFSIDKFEVERSSYDFDKRIPFTSTPENAIKKKYFHYKWLPIFSDGSGNYVGIDLDPDINGRIGQIINFGRDEEKMFVIADNLDSFFDLILEHMKTPESVLLNLKNHLHDTLRELRK